MAYAATSLQIGSPDITAVVTSGNLGDPTVITQLPSVTLEAKLGATVKAQDIANSWEAEFIYLAVPVSTTITVGLLYQFDKNFNVVVVPAGGTSKNTGVSVVVAYTAVTSNATAVQYAWFLKSGQVAALKTAVSVSPQQPIYMSATAGRFYVTASAGKQILNARTQNTATVSAGASTVNVYFNNSALEGF
jgi:hypothetical protein